MPVITIAKIRLKKSDHLIENQIPIIMKRKLISLFFFSFLIASTYAQRDTIFYYPSGKVAGKAQVLNGKPYGAYVGYHENGVIKEKGKYLDGLYSGVWEQFHDNGAIGRKTTFSKGVPTFVQDYFSGKVLREGGFLNGKQNGLWKEYSFVGNDYKETYLKKVMNSRTEFCMELLMSLMKKVVW